MRRRYLSLACVLSLTGCLWRSYDEILAVHLNVLTAMAAKLCAVVEAGKGPSAEDMAEYVYPLERGREFLRQFNRYGDRRSYREFIHFLDRYEGMIHRLDAARAQGRLAAELPQLLAERDALQQLAAEIGNQLRARN